MKLPSDLDKAAVWQSYDDRRPTRVPLRWNTNVRIILLDPALNPEGYTFEQYFRDPQVILTIQSRYQEHLATTYSRVADCPAQLPAQWRFRVDTQNTYDGAYLGAPVVFDDGQCPSNQAFLTEGEVSEFLARDFSRPLENPWLREKLALHAELVKAAQDFTYLGRRGEVAPLGIAFDGPVTVAAIIMGTDFFTLLGTEPELAVAFMRKITEAAIGRTRALGDLNGGWVKGEIGVLADDSIQLLSTAMYEELVLPIHEYWYRETSSATPASGKRGIHLCGDVMRHLPILHRHLGVASFDTGFPFDHGRMRRELGPEVEISGGPQVALLCNGTPDQCATRAREILGSGIMTGGRFILQEGNNLPPGCALENLAAVYQTCLEYGRYGA